LGRVLPGLLSTLFVGILFAIIFIGPISMPSIAAFLLGIFLLFLGYTLDFFINFSIGLTSFWVEDQEPFAWIYQRIQYIFGGVIVPLSLFPDKIAKIAEYLPFSHLYYGAARTIVQFEPKLFLKFLTVQFGWIILFIFIAILIFKKGIKNVSINAG
jgi:ABC-2 type transport system permease protein